MVKEERIHVCHLVYSFDIGGLERVIADCIKTLDQEQYRHSIIALTEVGAFANEVEEHANFYSLHKTKGHDFSIHLKLFNLIKKIRPDILHSYNLSTIEYQWLACIASVPLRIHAEHGRDSYDIHGSIKKYQILRRLMSPFINHFVSVSLDLHNWMLNDVRLPVKKLNLIRNGIDTKYYNPSFASKTNKGIYKDKFVFGHVSRLHPIKNQCFLIEQFYQACSESNSFKDNCLLVIVGSGPDKDKLEKQALQNESLKGKVIFTGSKTNVRDYYGMFDVFVMSSIAEGIPMTLLESMAMGLPHLVTSVGGIKEVILNEQTGLSLENNEKHTYYLKMIDLFNDRERLHAMSNKARQRIVSDYSQDKMVDAYNIIYKTVAN
ncbi:MULTISPECIES: glycosyltransferase [Vibrio]|jgi:sugar transferase (PEP-CTERM/EpsH1 system associated)|uniref:glycosyltransferase n=1 Tax=Vibrio TaxID=662 RepID=UPI000BFFF8FE|nr:glycosyltransferase [Vibrio sp. PID17_43]